MLLDKFNPTDNISVIEGFLPNHMSEIFLYELQKRGFYVWVMGRYKKMKIGGKNMFENRSDKWLISQYNRHRDVTDQIHTIEELRREIKKLEKNNVEL